MFKNNTFSSLWLSDVILSQYSSDLISQDFSTKTLNYVNNIGGKPINTINLNFDEYERKKVINKYITLLLCIKYSSYQYPPKEIRQILLCKVFKSEQDYEQDCFDKCLKDSQIFCAKYNTIESFCGFAICVFRHGYSLPQNVMKIIHNLIFQYNLQSLKDKSIKGASAAA